MQINIKFELKDFDNESDLEIKWFKLLDILYFTSEKIVLEIGNKELDFLANNKLCSEKLKVVLWKNKNNISLANGVCVENL